MKWLGSDKYELNSGKEVYANNGIIGLDPTLERISEGYDGGVCHIGSSAYTKEETLEIVDYMIELWILLKEKIMKEKI